MPINIRRDKLSVVGSKNKVFYSDEEKQDSTLNKTDTLHWCVEKNKSKESKIFCTIPFKWNTEDRDN